MVEKRTRLVYLGDEISEVPSFMEFNKLPTLRQTENAINYSRILVRGYKPENKGIIHIGGEVSKCRFYRIKTGGGEEDLYAISDSVIAKISGDGDILSYIPFTYFVRR